ncbi:hypothetical protein ABLO27_11135 [Roseibium sp. SCPC15]|uniref:hypothetical protein n=1 Tax=Roseibium sp. SCP15 TaxID=3141376 RepID=UPI00333D602A
MKFLVPSKLASLLASLVIAVMTMGGVASASPVINFDIDGPGSSVSTSGLPGLSASLVPGLGNEMFSLAQGESRTFDFFTLTIDRFFAFNESYNIEATLAFDEPVGTGPAQGSGGGVASTFFGLISGGTLFWDDSTLPDFFTTANGSIFSVDFAEGLALTLGNTATVQATVTATSVVPIPAALPLMAGGLGLLGFMGWRRKRLAA